MKRWEDCLRFYEIVSTVLFVLFDLHNSAKLADQLPRHGSVTGYQ